VGRQAVLIAAFAVLVHGCALPPAGTAPEGQLAPQPAAPSTRFVDGNAALLLVDGPRTHQAMFRAMALARDHINLESYILQSGEVGDQLAALLEKKVRQGVKVNVLYDSVGSFSTPQEYFERLEKSGVALCEFNPVNPAKAPRGWELNNRNHRKILVVDGAVGFTGGINISDVYASGSLTARRRTAKNKEEEQARDKKNGWRDTQVRLDGPVIAQLQRVFLDAWALQDCGPIAEAAYFPRVGPRGDKMMRVVKTDPASGSETHATVLSAIAQARSRVWITMGYFVPDPATLRALTDAARRGVDVRLVLPGFTDFWAPIYAGRSRYAELLAAGVRIFEWHDALMHAKTAVIDSTWSSVGSTNLDWRSFVHNYEADVIVLDAAFAREMERRFVLDVQASVEVDPAKWRRRGPFEKLKEWVARQWEYLL
jgi:cardiolipin synthase